MALAAGWWWRGRRDAARQSPSSKASPPDAVGQDCLASSRAALAARCSLLSVAAWQSANLLLRRNAALPLLLRRDQGARTLPRHRARGVKERKKHSFTAAFTARVLAPSVARVTLPWRSGEVPSATE